MRLATLLYIKNKNSEYLLMKRTRDPNKGLMSPPGGKLNMDDAESPVQCAVREAMEECLIQSKTSDWKLRGIVTEKNFPGAGNIMIFIMEYLPELNELPPPCNEGEFSFVSPDDFKNYKMPVTDSHYIWSEIFKNDSEVFFLDLDCTNYPEIIRSN